MVRNAQQRQSVPIILSNCSLAKRRRIPPILLRVQVSARDSAFDSPGPEHLGARTGYYTTRALIHHRCRALARTMHCQDLGPAPLIAALTGGRRGPGAGGRWWGSHSHARTNAQRQCSSGGEWWTHAKPRPRPHSRPTNATPRPSRHGSVSASQEEDRGGCQREKVDCPGRKKKN